MAICKKCGKTYYSKICPYCNDININEKEIEEIQKIKDKQKKIIEKANRNKINFGSGNVNSEYRKKTYKEILNNKIKNKNFLYDLEHKDPRLKSGKVKTKVKNNNKTFIYLIVIGIILSILTILRNL